MHGLFPKHDFHNRFFWKYSVMVKRKEQEEVRELEGGERPSAYFFKVTKAKQNDSLMSGLVGEGGLKTEPQLMLAVAEKFYLDLFQKRQCDSEVEKVLLGYIGNRLEGGMSQTLEKPLSLEKVSNALMSMRDGRAPGHDGLPKEFYMTFWEVLGPDLLEVYKCGERGLLADYEGGNFGFIV